MALGREWRWWRDNSYCGDEDCQICRTEIFSGKSCQLPLFVDGGGGRMTTEATNGHHVPPTASASAPTVVENTELNRDGWLSVGKFYG